MARIPCVQCQGSGMDGACPTCGGAGEVDALDQFGITEAHLVAMFRMTADLVEKCADILDKCIDIFEKVNE